VLDRYAAKDAFFKEVLDSQRNFAKTVGAVLDEDQRPVLEPRQRGPRRAAEVTC
jgi:hypothetical protein